ncbi:hypothetical protein AHF37_12087 [Paragonimus kellicotti]|nr:hypothetical protein AHF37_12087 [Paragonimus kellicotti]
MPERCNIESHSFRTELNEHGHVQLSGSNLPFLIDELLRINHSVRNVLVELDQRRRDLLASVNSVQTQLEHVRSLLFEHSKQFLRLRVRRSTILKNMKIDQHMKVAIVMIMFPP